MLQLKIQADRVPNPSAATGSNASVLGACCVEGGNGLQQWFSKDAKAGTGFSVRLMMSHTKLLCVVITSTPRGAGDAWALDSDENPGIGRQAKVWKARCDAAWQAVLSGRLVPVLG